MSNQSNQPLAPRSETDAQESVFSDAAWLTVVHDDPVNLMAYVQWVFESYFGMTSTVARERMLAVHRKGRAVLAAGGREAMERDVQAMHTYGLRATIEQEA